MQNDVPPAATGAWNPVEVTRADLEAWCARAALPPPPVGAGLSGRILQIGEHVFASWRAATPPYDFAALMAEAQDGDWLLGIDGHGTESWALHWVERRGPLLPGMQVRTSGAFAPSAVDLDAVQGAWALIGRFDAALARGQASGRLAEGQVLAVIDSDLGAGRYGWLAHDGPWDQAGWRDDPMAGFAALMELEALAAPAAASAGGREASG